MLTCSGVEGRGGRRTPASSKGGSMSMRSVQAAFASLALVVAFAAAPALAAGKQSIRQISPDNAVGLDDGPTAAVPADPLPKGEKPDPMVTRKDISNLTQL